MKTKANKSRSRARNARTRNETAESSTAVAAAAVETTPPEKEKSIMSQLVEHEGVRIAAPFVGAAGGALAATIAVERFGMRREVVTLGGAVLAVAAAQGQSGIVRSLLDGAAMAGVCLGVVELLRTNRPKWAFGNQPEAVAQRQADPPADAVTRADLEKALQAIHASHAAELAKRDDLHLVQMREAQATMHDLLERLRNADTEIARLRRIEIARDRRDAANFATTSSEPIVPTVVDVGELATDTVVQESADDEPIVNESVTASEATESSVDADELAHMRAVYALLDDNERQRLSTIIENAPKEALAREEETLLSMSPADGVAYLRGSVFPTAGLVA